MPSLALTLSADALRRFACDMLAAKGLDAGDARTVADALLWADLRGVGTHGVARLPQYFGFLDRGDIDPRARPEVTTDLPAAARIDAHQAAGPVAMQFAIDVVAEKARTSAIGLAVVARTTHTGAIGLYTQALARRGFAALALTAVNPFMLYHGSTAAGLGTNPLSIAVPSAEGEPVLLDMTTGAGSMGQVQQARRTGKALAPGIAADEQGRPVTHPQLAKFVLPLGGARGSGLSLMIELLASHLAGQPLLAEALGRTPLGKKHRQNVVLVAIDIARFVAPADWSAMAARLAQAIHALPPAQEDEPVRLPGERGDRQAAENARTGITLPPAVVDELTAAAASLGLDPKNYAS